MGRGAAVNGGPRRRDMLAAGLAAWGLAGCSADTPPAPPAQWVGASHERGHRLRSSAPGRAADGLPEPAMHRRAAVLVVGAGVAGLAAARAFARQGVDDVQVLELEDTPGGNARGHRLAGLACPLGAHYLPLPAPESVEVAEWLFELGLLRHELGRTVADERHLCHSPQERLWLDGAWAEGLLPPADPGSATARQYRRFAQLVAAASAPARPTASRRSTSVLPSQPGQRAQASPPPSSPRADHTGAARHAPGIVTHAARPFGQRPFAQPAHRAAWSAELATLDGQTFAAWLVRQGLDDTRLRWYLDYCCRDEYGAPADTVSAWAGLHYFASRHGFHAPGDDVLHGGSTSSDEPPDAVFTWPEGNAWLVRHLAAPLGGRLHTGRSVLQVQALRHGVQVLALDEASGRVEAWQAGTVVLAVPLAVAARLLAEPPDALRAAAGLVTYAPWLVANLHLQEPLLDRPGAPPAWDNVIYGQQGLGYVDAQHQSLHPHPGPTVLTAYLALPAAERAALLAQPAPFWLARVLGELQAAHPDIHHRVQQAALMRWGHGMAIPRPGLQRHPALQALRAMRGRVRFAHADLAGCSVFEEAFTAGCEVALPARA